MQIFSTQNILLIISFVLCSLRDVRSLICQINEYEILVAINEQQSSYGCNPTSFQGDTIRISDIHYKIDLPKSIIDEYKTIVASKQDAFLSIPDGEILIDVASIDIPDPFALSFVSLSEKNTDRHLTAEFWKNGRLRLLAVRILTNDENKPSFTADELYKVLFADANSLKWQMHRCSAGKLSFEPTDIGVLNIHVDMPATGDYTALVNLATSEAQRKLGVSSVQDYADLIMFITPPMDGWVAYGSVGGRITGYNDKWGAYLSVQMHEIGHNFLLTHANKNAPYEDRTGAMGGAIVGYHDKTGFPLLCYNSYNNYLLGWYDDRKIALNPDTPQLVTIAAFVDYLKTGGGQYVVANVDDQLFMQFNRAKDFNHDTYEYKDCLVIVQKMSGSEGTNLVAALNGNSNPKFEMRLTKSGSSSSRNLIIEICSWGGGNTDRPDYLQVSIGFDKSLCTSNRRLRSTLHQNISFAPFQWIDIGDESDFVTVQQNTTQQERM